MPRLPRFLPLSGLPLTLRYAMLPAAVTLALVAVLLALTQHLLTRELETQALARADQRARVMAMSLRASLQQSIQELRLLARSPALHRLDDSAALRADIEWLREHSPQFIWIGVVSPDGTVRAGTGGWLEGRSIAARPVFRDTLRGPFTGDAHPAVTLAPLMKDAGIPSQELLDIGEPIRDARGHVIAVLAAHVGTGWIEGLRNRMMPANDGRQMQGMSAHVVSGAMGRNVLADAGPPAGLPAGLAVPAVVTAHSGVAYIAAMRPLDLPQAAAALPWRVVVLQERRAALAPGRELMLAMAVSGGLAALLIGWWGYARARRLINPWQPLFDRVLSRLGSAPEGRTLAEAIDEIRREHAGPDSPPSQPDAEDLLARLARDAHQLRRVIDRLPFGVTITDADFRVRYLNAGATRLLGWTTEQVRGTVTGTAIQDPVQAAGITRLISQLGSPPGEVAARFEARTADGRLVPVQWQLLPLLDEQGRVEGGIAVTQDIRAERAARAQAEAMAGRLRALADAAVDDLIATHDADGRILEWSRGAERLTGFEAAQAIGRDFAELMLPQDADGQPVRGWRAQALREGRSAVAGWMTRADGQRRWFDGTLYALGLAPGRARFGLLMRDTTAMRETAAQLEASEARLRLAIDSAGVDIWQIVAEDGDWHIRWTDRPSAHGDGPTQTRDMSLAAYYERIHPDDRPQLQAAVQRTLDHDLPFDSEFRLMLRDGSVAWHAGYGRALRRPDGTVERVVGVGLDVTRRHKAEAAQRAEEERLTQVVDTMAEGLIILDREGRCTLVNPAAQAIFGVEASQMLGQHCDDAPWKRLDLDGHPLPPATRPFDRIRATGADIHGLRFGIERADGSRRVISLNGTVIRDPQGQFDGIVFSCADISDAHAAERALAESQARLVAIVESVNDAIVSTDLAGAIRFVNPAATRIFRRSPEAMVGQPIDLLLAPSARVRHQQHLERLASGPPAAGMPRGRQVQGLRADGQAIELELDVTMGQVGSERLATAVLRDIGERLAQERALAAYRSELGQLTRRLLEQEKDTTRRLAQMLHDELGQTLTALRLHWDAMHSLGQTAGSPQAHRIDQLVEAANQQIRGVLNNLRPPLLDELGLSAALGNEIQRQVPHDPAIEVGLAVPEHLRDTRWPTDVEYAALMVGREALANALAHAQAHRILVSIDGSDSELTMAVSDDGIGLPRSARSGRPGHLGLVGMRERAAAIGATLHLDAPPEGGTIVTLHWQSQDDPDLPGR
jgi:PAS domain S-box-containing protein